MENNQIFFLLPNLKFGGAERVSINLASNLKERGFEVYFLLMSLEGEFLKEAKTKKRMASQGKTTRAVSVGPGPNGER